MVGDQWGKRKAFETPPVMERSGVCVFGGWGNG
jgi:hypothetical protein